MPLRDALLVYMRENGTQTGGEDLILVVVFFTCIGIEVALYARFLSLLGKWERCELVVNWCL